MHSLYVNANVHDTHTDSSIDTHTHTFGRAPLSCCSMFVSARGLCNLEGLWIPNPGRPTIDLCHCVHFQPLQRSPCESPLLCIHLLLLLLCINCISFPITLSTLSQNPFSPVYSLKQTVSTDTRKSQKYNFAVWLCEDGYPQCCKLVPFLCNALGNCPRLPQSEWIC